MRDRGASRPATREHLTRLLADRWIAIFSLAVTSLVSGLSEAGFLVLITSTAFAITGGMSEVAIVGDWTLSIGGVVLLAVLLVLVRVVLALLGAWQAARLRTVVVAEIRRDLSAAFLTASYKVQHDGRSGRLQELLTTFSQEGAALIGSITHFIVSAFNLLAILGVAVATDPTAAAFVVAIVAVLSTVLRPLRNLVRRRSEVTAGVGMEFATTLSEFSALGMEIHVFNVQGAAKKRIEALVDDYFGKSMKFEIIKGFVPAVYMGLAYLALVGLLGLAAGVAITDILAVGTVIVLMLRSLNYGQVMQTSSSNVGASLPFLEVLENEKQLYVSSAPTGQVENLPSLSSISLRDVSFEYEPDKPVLRDVDVTIGPKEILGIVGPSGSGKSTLVQILLGLREPTAGWVEVDGKDLAVIAREDWARRVTFVPQQAHLIAGTVADNIRFLRDGVDDDAIERASRLANLHEDVSGWPEGYQRQVGERGGHLSGGQQQRLMIARALVESPDLLVLDEPTSSLDVRSEQLIRGTLQDLREHMSIVIIAHRLSTLELCDRIMVVQGGVIRAIDTPENLERDNEFYREALKLSGMR